MILSMPDSFRKSLSHLLILGSATLAACGEEKPKVDLGDSFEETSWAVERRGGWNEIQTLESAHPYANRYTRSWEVKGSEDASRMRVVFDRFELEDGYDVLTISSGDVKNAVSGNKTGRELIFQGNSVRFDLATDGSVTKWGFKARVFEEKPCICPMIARPVCGVDGTQYSNDCAASCAGVAIDYAGQCRNDWFPVARGIESLHPYKNDTDFQWEVGEGGATRMRLHFASIDLERGYDKLEVRDAEDRVIVEYTGKQTNVTTPAISGSLAKIRLLTDSSVTKYGFVMDSYEVVGGCTSASDCGPGQTCVQPQCIRAPCFSMCVADTPAVLPVSLEELTQNSANYSGKVVQVTAEPKAGTAACTRIACPDTNPCCNRCSSSFAINDSIQLVTPGGEPMGCSGDQCSVNSACEPFRAERNGDYELTGRFEVDEWGSKRLFVESFRAASCAKNGCSGQICSNAPVFTPCDFREEYMCYRDAACEAQADGHCGFTATPELEACLAGDRDISVQSGDTPIEIPDASSTGIRSQILVPQGGPIQVAKLSLQIRHPYRGDLKVTLVGPDGTELLLHDRQGGSSDDLAMTDRILDGFTGRPSQGTWTLKVADTGRADVGTLETWSILFTR